MTAPVVIPAWAVAAVVLAFFCGALLGWVAGRDWDKVVR